MKKNSAAAWAVCAIIGLTIADVSGAETPKNDPPKTPEVAKPEKPDPYKMPEGADAKALVEFCKGVIAERKKVRSQAQYNEYQAKSRPVLETACTRILELEKSDTTEMGRFARRNLLGSNLVEITKPNTPKAQQFLEDLNKFLYAQEMSFEDTELAVGVGQGLEHFSPEKAKAFYEKLAPAMSKSSIPAVAARAKKIEGTMRRLNLMGNTMELKGTTVDGKPFDVAAWKGKVVLVDFWATWCHYCIEELPNVKKNYAGYHNKGFEVVGISGDQDRKKLEAFLAKEPLPWTTLHEDGGRNPAMDQYAIAGFPTVFLIGKDGKVISLAARGPALGKLLKEQLGEPEAPKEEPADPKTTPADPKAAPEKQPATK